MQCSRFSLSVAALLATLSVVGCSQNQPPIKTSTPSFSDQLALVQSGQSERILLESPISEAEFERCVGLANLGELLLDDPRTTCTPAMLRVIKTLPKLWHLRIRGPGIDDEALNPLAEMPALKILNLPQAKFSDSGLKKLARLPELEQLRFGSPNVTDAGLKSLVDFPALKRLHLIDVHLTDAGLRDLTKIKTLESLYIDGAELSDAALDELFAARPMLHVHFNQQHHDRDPHSHAH